MMQRYTPAVILLGQDPYPQRNTATGVAFANHERTGKYANIPLSPSLRVIRDSVLEFTGGGKFDETLMFWVRQGIFPMNIFWTVAYGKPLSHAPHWLNFTMRFLEEFSATNPHLIYVAFGKYAAMMEPHISNPGMFIRESHPSYYARTGEKMPVDVWRRVVEGARDILGKNLLLTMPNEEERRNLPEGGDTLGRP